MNCTSDRSLRRAFAARQPHVVEVDAVADFVSDTSIPAHLIPSVFSK
jgi:hypothetical protein